MQEWFVRERAAPPVVAVRFEGADAAAPAPGVLEALEPADTILVCPWNPVISIGPILAVPGVRDVLVAAARPRRRREPDHRRRAGEGPGRPAHGPARHRGVVRRRRPRVPRVLRHARDRHRRRGRAGRGRGRRRAQLVVADTLMRDARRRRRARRSTRSTPSPDGRAARSCPSRASPRSGRATRSRLLVADARRGQDTPLLDGDCLVVTQKVVSKAEGRLVPLDPADLAARRRLIESESVRVLRRRGDLVISETRARLRVRERRHRPLERRRRLRRAAPRRRRPVCPPHPQRDPARAPASTSR